MILLHTTNRCTVLHLEFDIILLQNVFILFTYYFITVITYFYDKYTNVIEQTKKKNEQWASTKNIIHSSLLIHYT